MTSPISTRVTINIPRLCKVMNMKVKHDERIFDLIYRIVNSAGLKETNSYRLFGSSDNFVQIPSEDLCSSLFLTCYDNLYLLTKDPRVITVYYENRKSVIAFDNDTESTELVSTAIKCLGLPLDDVMYILYDPDKNCMYPLDIPIQATHVVLKQFNIFTSQFLFGPSDFKVESSSLSFKILTLSKQLLPPIIRSLLQKIHHKFQRDRHNQFKLAELDPAKVESIFQNFSDDSTLNNLSDEEENALLFLLLSVNKKAYISVQMQTLITSSILASNDVERFNLIYGAICLMPLCTQCILIELCVCFSQIPSNRDLIVLLTRVIFPLAQNREAEELFISFVLLFQQWLLRLPKPNKSLMIYRREELVLVDRNSSNHPKSGKTVRGEIEFEENGEQLVEFNANLNVIDVIEALVNRKGDLREDFNLEKFNKLNSLLEKVAKLDAKKKALMVKIQEKIDQ